MCKIRRELEHARIKLRIIEGKRIPGDWKSWYKEVIPARHKVMELESLAWSAKNKKEA